MLVCRALIQIQTRTLIPIPYRSSKSSLSGKLVVEDANMNVREDISAPIKIDEDRGHATTVANSVLASLDSKSERGDQFHAREGETLQDDHTHQHIR